MLFDIGGGSSEIVWLRRPDGAPRPPERSIGTGPRCKLGVVTLAERFGGAEVSFAQFYAP